ncbi:MAG: type II toxin-antitoxin system PemK/MazF family toxin [Leptolyngbyaceae cyanobacterium RU_5_1]|nr:type II toxin-antitoxin system PemK/MazF family toxin [Leptolyngbyaceae cyanobacterium RU_5_1]
MSTTVSTLHLPTQYSLKCSSPPCLVRIGSVETGLPRDSVANMSQIFTLDKTRLTERVGSIPSDFQDQVDDGLRLVLYL